MVLAAGWGYGAPSLVGAGLAVLGVGVAVLSAVLERRSRVVAPVSGRPVDRAAVGAETTNA
jgi:DHA1 family inner membrane transport protein